MSRDDVERKYEDQDRLPHIEYGQVVDNVTDNAGQSIPTEPTQFSVELNT